MTDHRTAPRQTNASPISRLRIQRGLTQDQLADILGCPQATISRWEQGTNSPSTKSLRALAKALDCSIDDLIGDDL